MADCWRYLCNLGVDLILEIPAPHGNRKASQILHHKFFQTGQILQERALHTLVGWERLHQNRYSIQLVPCGDELKGMHGNEKKYFNLSFAMNSFETVFMDLNSDVIQGPQVCY